MMNVKAIDPESKAHWLLPAAAAILYLAPTFPANAQTSQVDIVAMSNALSTVSQRHMVRIQPVGHNPVTLLAVQNDGYSFQHYGLLWYRSDDGGATWSFYRDLLAQPDIAVYDPSRSPQTLHLTTDLIAVGNDIAAVYSYDTTSTSFPADVWDDRRAVYFQWWRYDGVNDWNPGSRVTIALPNGAQSQAYHRAEIAQDSAGRLWVQAFLRQNSCPNPGETSCLGDIIRVWVSTDGGASFQLSQNIATLTNQLGGGRLSSLGSKLMMLWSDYNTGHAAQISTRNDSDPLTTWSSPVNAFPDGAHIYHGAALSAAADGIGGLHLVYKEYIGPADQMQLYYRRYSGGAFGAKQAVDTNGDWVTQPAVTAVGTDLYVCLNHMVTTQTNYEMRLYKLSAGWSTYQAIDTQAVAKAYPTAPEVAPTNAPFIACGFCVGDLGTWGAGHTVQTSREPVTRPSNDIALFTDPWTGPNLGPLWTVSVDSAGSGYTVGGGVLTLIPEPGTGAAGVHVTSVGSYSLLGSQITIKVPQVVSSSGAVNSALYLVPSIGQQTVNDVGFEYDTGTLFLRYDVGGLESDVCTINYDPNPSLYRWWRLRELGGNIYWDTSPDGIAWTQCGSRSSTAITFPLDSVRVVLDSKAWGGGNPNPGNTQFSNLNN